jgi:hypothetical protein
MCNLIFQISTGLTMCSLETQIIVTIISYLFFGLIAYYVGLRQANQPREKKVYKYEGLTGLRPRPTRPINLLEYMHGENLNNMRFEVIDEKGRVYVRYNSLLHFSAQDDNKTLKVFVKQEKEL